VMVIVVEFAPQPGNTASASSKTSAKDLATGWTKKVSPPPPILLKRSVPTLTKWEELDINYHIVANIDQSKCIHCGLCYIACEDTSHQSIRLGYGNPYNTYTIKDKECVGCNLCKLMCPVTDSVTIVEQRTVSECMQLERLPKPQHATERPLVVEVCCHPELVEGLLMIFM
jgi:NAD-dependent dihydropyrimidine dehydrogenase PreA subunit